MPLDAILKHISGEVNLEKEKIMQDAQQKSDLIISEAKEQAKKIYDDIINKEKALLEGKRQQAIANARIENKKKVLAAKQMLIDEVFEKLKSQVNKEKIKKQQIMHDKVREVPQDIDFYFKEVRGDYETEVAKIIFK